MQLPKLFGRNSPLLKRTRLPILLLILLRHMGVPLWASASDLILVHARVYRAPNVIPLASATVVLHGGRIQSVRPEATGGRLRFPHGATVLDCAGMSVLAGFWNNHVHFIPASVLHADQKTDGQLTAAMQGMFTRWGFTTVFDIASILGNTEAIRKRIQAGRIDGPRILSTGEPFFPLRGVPSYIRDYLQEQHIVLPDDATTADAVARVHRQVAEGADGIKIFAGAIEGDDVLLMPLERASAIVVEAHRMNRPVFAHPSNMAGIRVALNSGVDVLAHPTSDDEPWSRGLVQDMLAAHMALIPTLTLFDVEATKAGASPEVIRKVVNRAVTRLRAYNDAGGEVLFGTDAGYIYQFSTEEEYRLMQSAGLSFAQILASLTTNPARRFGFRNRGQVAALMDADLTVVAGDPALEITALSRVRFTISAGKLVYSAVPASPARS